MNSSDDVAEIRPTSGNPDFIPLVASGLGRLSQTLATLLALGRPAMMPILAGVARPSLATFDTAASVPEAAIPLSRQGEAPIHWTIAPCYCASQRLSFQRPLSHGGEENLAVA